MKVNSLAFRLFATAAAWTLIVLPVAGLIIYSVYRQEAEANFDDRLKTLLTVILADSVEDGSEPSAPRAVGEPLFEITLSGWYWQIKPVDGADGKRLVSRSLATESLEAPHESKVRPDSSGVLWANVTGPGGRPARVAEMLFTFGDEITGPRYSFIVAGPLDWLQVRIRNFRTRLAIALSLAGVGLVAVTLFQVRFGLLPLRAIERGLAEIRSGAAARLRGELPSEIEPLQVELNALIQSNQEIVDRARTQVGNLAHALKTPLAVITNEARDDKGALAQKVVEQAEIMRKQVTHYLERARIVARIGAIGRLTEVKPAVEALQRALERIHRDRGVRIELSCPDGARFQGERHDFDEMLGNLLDNACKWARSLVKLTVSFSEPEGRLGPRRLIIVVEDDGPGLPEEQRARLGRRGMRLDETKPGSGLGLSIVTDLALSYRGSLKLEASAHGGLAARLDLPAA